MSRDLFIPITPELWQDEDKQTIALDAFAQKSWYVPIPTVGPMHSTMQTPIGQRTTQSNHEMSSRIVLAGIVDGFTKDESSFIFVSQNDYKHRLKIESVLQTEQHAACQI